MKKRFSPDQLIDNPGMAYHYGFSVKELAAAEAAARILASTVLLAEEFIDVPFIPEVDDVYPTYMTKFIREILQQDMVSGTEAVTGSRASRLGAHLKVLFEEGPIPFAYVHVARSKKARSQYIAATQKRHCLTSESQTASWFRQERIIVLVAEHTAMTDFQSQLLLMMPE